MPRFIRLALAALFLIGPLPARAADYYDFQPGAKAMGMGMAFSAVADDPYAMFFNPAGTANTPYSQTSTSLGRMLSPVGTMSFGALAYVRPYERINTATVGAAYHAARQTGGGDKDAFLFHFAREYRVPRVPLSKPVKVGANFKFVHAEGAGGAGFGMGFDAGVLAKGASGFSGAFVLSDLTSQVGKPRGVLTIGAAYLWKRWLTVATDLRVRRNLTEFYPGLEAAFHQGLLKVRAGRGFQLDGVSQMAFGLGVDFSPAVLDVAMTVPAGGIHRRGGHYQASFTYRFGAPSFAGRFVGQAAAQAESLRERIRELEDKTQEAEAKAKEADVRREIAEGEVAVLEQRVKELKDEYRLLEKRRDDAAFAEREEALRRQVAEEAALPKQLPVLHPPPPKKPLPWPRRHEVRPGQTLRSLARQYYGDANLWEAIYQANRDKVERGLPVVGAILAIPAPPPRER